MKTNLMNMNTLRSASSALFVAVFAVAVFSVAPFAHAQYDDGGDYSGGCCGGSDLTGIDYSYPQSYGSDLTGIDYSYPQSSDYTTSSGYAGTSYMTGSYGFSSGGYGYSVPFGGYSGGSSVYAPSNTWDNGNTNIYAPTQTNTCTAGNSCNTNIVTNTTNPAPVVYNTPSTPVYYTNPQPVYYPAPNYNTCNTCGCLGYPVCPQPVVYNSNPTPYITLSQVPYTGLDLGFWGTIAYWSFFVLWCLAAAYLIVVKKVQNRIYRAMKNFLFGAPVSETAQHGVVETSTLDVNALASQIAAMINPQTATPNGAPVAGRATGFEDKTDEFVLAQIHRPLR